MNRYIILVLMAMVGFQNCTFDKRSSNSTPETDLPQRLHRALIKKEGIELDWFYYSLIDNTTPDYVTASNEGITDTILVSNFITDIHIKKDTIFIELYNRPSSEQRNFKIPHQIFDYHIKVDSTIKVKPRENVPSFIYE